MAFFHDKNGSNYFGIYYFDDGNSKFSGAFHELNSKAANFFARMYHFFAIYFIVMFLIELTIATLSVNELILWGESAFIFFIFSAVLPILLLAVFIVTKKRVKFKEKIMILEMEKSIFVYILVIMSSANYCVTLVWGNMTNHIMSNFYVYILLFIVAAATARLFAVLRCNKK